MKSPLPKVYLAGFDVFLPNSLAKGEYLKELCAFHGFQGLYPMDNQVPPGMSKAEMAAWICKANQAMIHEADYVLANLNPFRGHEPDSGTAYEVGYASALGKPIWGYSQDHSPMIEQVPNRDGFDEEGFAVEDFDFSHNLMIATSWAGLSTSVEVAIQELLQYHLMHKTLKDQDAAPAKVTREAKELALDPL